MCTMKFYGGTKFHFNNNFISPPNRSLDVSLLIKRKTFSDFSSATRAQMIERKIAKDVMCACVYFWCGSREHRRGNGKGGILEGERKKCTGNAPRNIAFE